MDVQSGESEEEEVTGEGMGEVSIGYQHLNVKSAFSVESPCDSS